MIFFAINEDKLQQDITKKYHDLFSQYTIIRIPDSFILENADSLAKTFECYWNDLNTHGKGLNYYGITLLKPEQINDFETAILNCNKTKRNQKSVAKLMRLCDIAKKHNKLIVHIGI